MKKLLILILSISVVFPQLSIKDKQIYDNKINKYYSADEFIKSLNSDTNFVDDKNFMNYKKYANRLKFKKSKYIYGLSLMSIVTGHDGIVNSDEFKDDDDPPGVENIAFGILLSSSYYAYNTIKKKKSLYDVIQRHNNIYSKDKIIDLPPPNNYTFKGNASYGLFSERIPFSILAYTISMHTNEHSEFYATIHGMILYGAGIGIGYKYYNSSKMNSSSFMSICAHTTTLGTFDSGIGIQGISLSPGYSWFLGEKKYSTQKFSWKTLTSSMESINMKTFLNIGISLTYAYQNNQNETNPKYDFGLLPFISLESKF